MAHRNSPLQKNTGLERNHMQADLLRFHMNAERRPMQHGDRPFASNNKEKGKARYKKPSAKKRRVIPVSDSDSSTREIADGDPDWRYKCVVRAFCHCSGIVASLVLRV